MKAKRCVAGAPVLLLEMISLKPFERHTTPVGRGEVNIPGAKAQKIKRTLKIINGSKSVLIPLIPRAKGEESRISRGQRYMVCRHQHGVKEHIKIK